MARTINRSPKGRRALVEAALFGACPQCSERTLFEAPASIAIECSHCGLDFAKLERGARLAGLLTMVLAGGLIALALWIDGLVQFPLWLLALVWGPVTIATVLGALRFYKTALLYAAFEQRHEAEGDQAIDGQAMDGQAMDKAL
jgi:uncharacterized protein (DUF983 family)